MSHPLLRAEQEEELVKDPPFHPACRTAPSPKSIGSNVGITLACNTDAERITPTSLHRARTSHSRGIRLHRRRTCRWLTLPLSVVGGHVYRAFSPNRSASQRVCVINDRRARSRLCKSEDTHAGDFTQTAFRALRWANKMNVTGGILRLDERVLLGMFADDRKPHLIPHLTALGLQSFTD